MHHHDSGNLLLTIILLFGSITLVSVHAVLSIIAVLLAIVYHVAKIIQLKNRKR